MTILEIIQNYFFVILSIIVLLIAGHKTIACDLSLLMIIIYPFNIPNSLIWIFIVLTMISAGNKLIEQDRCHDEAYNNNVAMIHLAKAIKKENE